MDKNPEITSVRIIEEYYNNNTQLFFDSIDENVVWIGPAISQYIEGKQNLLTAFSKENNTLKFRMEETSSKTIAGAKGSSCEVLLKFIVYTYYPSGHISIHHQRITLFWRKVKINKISVWKIALLHISNGMEIDKRDNIYPLHFDEFEAKHFNVNFDNLKKQQNERLIVHGIDCSTYYIEYKDIIFIRGGKAKMCEIHTKSKVILVRLLIDEIKNLLPKQFFRPHRSYIVNAYDIVRLYRYRIVLDNNAEIPIPPKKYNQIVLQTTELLEKICHN